MRIKTLARPLRLNFIKLGCIPFITYILDIITNL